MAAYRYGVLCVLFTDEESADFMSDLPETDLHRETAEGVAASTTVPVEILEGPPELIAGTEWVYEPAQIWKYPARRKA